VLGYRMETQKARRSGSVIGRWILNILSVTGGLLCAATVALWIRSYYHYDTIEDRSATRWMTLASADGTCMAAMWTHANWPQGAFFFRFIGGRWVATPIPQGWFHISTLPSETFAGTNYIQWFTPYSVLVIRGFHFSGSLASPNLTVPHWFLVIAFGMVGASRWAAIAIGRAMRMSGFDRRRVRRGRRWLIISIVTIAAALPLVVALAGFTFSDAWHAVWGTPLMYGLFVILPLGGLILSVGVLLLQKRRFKDFEARRLCPTCGYNLTGNTSGVCPECGTTAALT